MPTFLVTGGAGFIGSNIVKYLLSEGEKVKVLDNFSTGKKENIKDVQDQIDLIVGDIRDLEIVNESVCGVDYILHQAALPSVPRSIIDPISTTSVNVDGLLNLLIASKESKVKKFVMASSSSVYGNNPIFPKSENMLKNPLSPYALTKLTGEQYCKIFSDIFKVKTICLRYFNVFGPRQDPKSQYSAVIPKFINSILNGESPIIFGDGEQTRDFTFIENVVHANILAAKSDISDGRSINIACGQRISVNELVKQLEIILSKKVNPIYKNIRKGDVKHSLADIGLARECLGFDPKITFDEGLKKTVKWFTEGRIWK